MTIAPVIKTVDVRCPPARAFELFTGRMAAWWPATHHIGGASFAAIVIEPLAGGRWFERDAAGVETQWGKVLAWGPPGRVLLAWQLNADWKYDPDLETELEITFAPVGAGTRVRLEHRNLERFGDSAERIAEMLRGGWPTIAEGFASFADQHLEEGV
jgi:uncharacterized protein YndB with AHSA1/START domain